MEGMGISKHARVLVQTGAKPRRLVGSTPRRPLRTRRREPLPDKGDGGLHKDTKARPAPDPTSQFVSEQSLLQELNSSPGSAAEAASMSLMMEQDWALEGLDGFARARMKQQAARQASHSSASTSRAPSADPGVESKGAEAGSCKLRSVYPSAIPSWLHTSSSKSASASGNKETSTAKVELDALYARRNPGVVEALRMMKRVVHVRGASGAAELAQKGNGYLEGVSSVRKEEEEEEEEEEKGLDWRDDDGTDGLIGEASAPDAGLQATLKKAEFPLPSVGAASAPTPSAAWTDSLGMAGFVQRQSADLDGTMFLERVPSLPAVAASPRESQDKARGGSSSGSRTVGAAAGAAHASQAPPSPPAAVLAAAAASLVPRKDTRPKLKQALRQLDSAEQVLDLAVALYPTWASCGCRLAAPELLLAMMHTYKQSTAAAAAAAAAAQDQQGRAQRQKGRRNADDPSAIGAGAAAALVPTPAEAAQILQGVAVAMRRAGWGRARCLQLCSDTRLAGLVEALRAVPPRLSTEQQQQEQLSRAFFRSARAYWLQHGDGGAGEKTGPSTAVSPSLQHVGGSKLEVEVLSSGGQSSTSGGRSTSSAAQPSDEYEQTLQRFLSEQHQRGASAVEAGSQGAAAEEALKETRRGVTHKAVISAVWALAVMGGPTLYNAEVEALLQIAKAGGSNWRFYEGEGANLAWALAASRHWSRRLEDLEEGLVQSGGMSSLNPSDAVRVLWAFATLGGPPPRRLLSTLHPQWRWRVLPRTASFAFSNSRNSKQSKSSSNGPLGGTSSEGHDWDPLESDPTPKVSLFSSNSSSSNESEMDTKKIGSSLGAAAVASTSIPGPTYTSDAPTSTRGSSAARNSRRLPVLHLAQDGSAPNSLGGFTTSQLAGCCWALAVMPGGLETPAFSSAWVHLIGRLANTVQGTGERQQQQPQQQQQFAGSADGCSDSVLSQIWQAAMAIHLDSPWAQPTPTQQQQQQLEPKSNRSSAAATVTAALSLFQHSRRPDVHSNRQQQHVADPGPPGSFSSQQHQSHSRTSTRKASGQPSSSSSNSSSGSSEVSDGAATSAAAAQEPGTSSAEVSFTEAAELSRAEAALLTAHAAFLRCSRALRGAGGHSSYQRGIANSLTGMRLMHVLEDSSSGYSVDISLPHLKLAIEADGPSHFSRTPGPPTKPAAPTKVSPSQGGSLLSSSVVSGPTAMKRRHLRAMGWALVSVPFTVWDKLGSETARQQYLQQRISQAVTERMVTSTQM